MLNDEAHTRPEIEPPEFVQQVYVDVQVLIFKAVICSSLQSKSQERIGLIIQLNPTGELPLIPGKSYSGVNGNLKGIPGVRDESFLPPFAFRQYFIVFCLLCTEGGNTGYKR